MRKCPRCNLLKPITDFNKHRTRKTQTYCKECQRIRDREFYKKTRISHIKRKNDRKKLLREYITNFKKQSICKCGESDYRCLCFHHRNQTKKTASMTELIRRGVGLITIQKEIKKCDILCFNCHAKIHNGYHWKTKSVKLSRKHA